MKKLDDTQKLHEVEGKSLEPRLVEGREEWNIGVARRMCECKYCRGVAEGECEFKHIRRYSEKWVREKLESDKRPVDEEYKRLEPQLLPLFPDGEKITVAKLKEWLRLHNLPVSGRKAELAQRIVDSIQNNTSTDVGPVLAADYIVDDDDLEPNADDEDDDDDDDDPGGD
mmetsp:Transcript_4577/g.8910  ORF Transcript_4577/g.8910 Transcript_4577/m.8910 type:complete len:170 (-) Transcript_4577:63-572(-)